MVTKVQIGVPGHADAKAIVVMGVAGSGKTAVGKALAAALGWRFIEGDEFHPPENIARMSHGQPLTDADRAGWLDAIGNELAAALARGESAIAACSALKRDYRDRLRRLVPSLHILYLKIDPQTARERVAARKNHFMPASLIESQFADLMPPAEDEQVLVLDAGKPVATLIAEARTFAEAQ